MRRPGWLWLALVVPACLGLQLWIHAVIVDGPTDAMRFGVALASGVMHAAINLALLSLFGRTILPGREPLVTGLARRVHGVLPPQMERYTRRVTIAWCVFFAMQLATSAVLFVWSLEAWSLFVNVLSWPLVVLMFVVEYAYRLVACRGFAHATFLQSVQAFTDDMRATPAPGSRRRTRG